MASDLATELQDAERRLLKELRGHRRSLRKQGDGTGKLTPGQWLADWVAAKMGSWPFIIVQSVILFFWIVANVLAWKYKWDPYPFILLNLALSFQAAYAAPIIMMSQNRQSDIDRKKAENDYNVNIKAELEIELLHQKIDELREKQMEALTQAVADLTAHVKNEQAALAAPKAAPATPANASRSPATAKPRAARAKKS
jgi:uncharacterized membrane protein